MFIVIKVNGEMDVQMEKALKDIINKILLILELLSMALRQVMELILGITVPVNILDSSQKD